MTEASREELIAVKNSLNNRIGALERKVNLLPDPFSKLSFLQVRKGGTGAARIRRLYLTLTGTHVTDSHTSLTNIAHFDLPNSTTTKIYFQPVQIPSDYIATFPLTLNWLYANTGTSGDVAWSPSIRTLRDGLETTTGRYATTTNDTVPSIGNRMDVLSKSLVSLPLSNDFFSGYISRLGSDGGDTNTSETHLYAAWIEYVAFI